MAVVEAVLLPAGAAFAALVVLMPVLMRFPWPTSPTLRVFAAGVAVYLGALALGPRVFPAFAPWHFTAVYGLMFMFVWFLFGAVAKSISVLMAFRLAANGGRASRAALDPIDEFTDRVTLLVDTGKVERTAAGDYALTPDGRRFVARLKRARKSIHVDTQGIYGLGG